MKCEFFTKCPECNPYLLGKRRPRKGRRAAVEEAIARSKRHKGKWIFTH
jgi:hypothetical protein